MRALLVSIALVMGCRPECTDWTHVWAATESCGDVIVAGQFGGQVKLFGEKLTARSVSGSFLVRVAPAGVARWARTLETFPEPRTLTLFPPYASSKVVAADDGDCIVTGGGAGATRYDRDGAVVWRWPLDPLAYRSGWVEVAALAGGRTAIFQVHELVVIDREAKVIWRRSIEGMGVDRLLRVGDALFVAGMAAASKVVLVRIDALSGMVVWVKALFGDLTVGALDWGVASNAIVILARGRGLVADGGPTSTAVLEVDADGQVRWVRDLGPTQTQTWAVAVASDRILVAGETYTGVTSALFDADGTPHERRELALVPSGRRLRAMSLSALGDRVVLTGMTVPSGIVEPLDCEVSSVMALLRDGEIDQVLLGGER
jgi:hypothetical protein